MAKVVHEWVGSGTWLGVEHDGSRVIGAHAQVDASPDTPLTVMWTGMPTPDGLIDFCQALSPTLGHAGPTRRRGRVFASKGAATFDGRRWLEAATVPSARFVRLECEPLAAGHDGQSVILWARLDARPPEAGAFDEEEENVGVQLAPGHLSSLERPLATLIAGSMPGGPGFDVALLAIRALAAYFSPRSTPVQRMR